MVSYVVANGDIDTIKTTHEARSKFGKQRQGDTKLLYIPGYYDEIRRKVEDHIIPFVEKRDMYRVLK